jgi:hypothetical protein
MASRGRPPKQEADRHPKRIVFMADAATEAWLSWRIAETGASRSEIVRRAVKAYMAANPAASSKPRGSG